MRLPNTIFVLLLLPFVFSLPIERLKQQLANANGLEGLSALERCNRGFPMLVEVKEPATFDRPAYEPCETDSQCREGLMCLCQDTGGKECAPPCLTPDGSVVPNDGQYHEINCQLNCICDGGNVACTPLCEDGLGAHCDGGAAFRLNWTPDPDGGCCPKWNCDGPWVVLSPEDSDSPTWYSIQSTDNGGYFLSYDPDLNIANDPFLGDTDQSRAVTFKVVPVNPENQHDTWLKFDADFYLVSPSGKYIERGLRMNDDPCNGGLFDSCRWGLAYTDTPTQTWRTVMPDENRTAFVPENGMIGIDVGGTGTDEFKPDNNRRRKITLRRDVSIVVNWWYGDEHIKFVRA